MEFFFEFFFQPISRAIRKCLIIGGPLLLTYSSLHSKLSRFVVILFFFFFTFFRSIFLISYSDIYIHIVLYIFIYFVVRYRTNSASDVIGIDSQPVDFRGSMLLSRFVVDLECKPRYETKLSDQVNLFDSRMGEGRRGRNGGKTNKGKTKTRERSRSLFLGRVVLAYSWHVSRVLSPPFRFVIPSAPKDFQSLPLS